jgi:predicted XRE-type DNA-binding protein
MKTIKWADLKAKMSPEAQARAAERTRELEHELRLNEIRRARGLAQATIAEALDITQSEV